MTVAIRNILVHADRTAASAQRVALAADFAGRLGATLTGATAGTAYIPSYAPFGETFVSLQPEIIEAATRQIATALSDAEARFRAAAGDRAVAWRQSQTCAADVFLALAARSADLIVIGRPVSDDIDAALGLNPSDLLMAAGRPVLIAGADAGRLSARRIVVGWKDTRESRRAVADALPLLIAAEEVFVVAAGADDASNSAAEIVHWLGSHGATARAVAEGGTDADAASALIAVARRVDADLIVAGAFGHSRARQWAFGGVTRSLLGESGLTVLLSH